ncbi:MAG: GNAT family N-acetyltransferase [Nevskiales bacterium]|nr:GNAT family N-acetyltransferase [Nevskiales bacterium]
MTRAAAAGGGADLQVHPVDASRWKDLETLFGANGACAGCWCMYWRLPTRQFNEQSRDHGPANRAALQALVRDGACPGLIAYAGTEPVGWVALAPRSAYPRLDRSRVLKPVDDRPVWSISCFFVRRGWRHKGVSTVLLRAAVAYATGAGVACIEAYPTDRDGRTGDPFVFTGLASTFRAAGFGEVARRSPTRPIMRLELG